MSMKTGFRPFHETIVGAILAVSTFEEFVCLENLIGTTKIPCNHASITQALETTSKKLKIIINGDVLSLLQKQKQQVETMAKNKGINNQRRLKLERREWEMNSD